MDTGVPRYKERLMKKGNARGTGNTAHTGIAAGIGITAVALAFAAAVLAGCDTAVMGGAGDPVLSSISISGPAEKNYLQGMPFSATGLTVSARYDDGTALPVTSGYSLSWNGQTIADGDTSVTAEPGDKAIDVSWQGKTASFSIWVGTGSFTIGSAAEWNAALEGIKTRGNGKSYLLTIGGSFSVPPSSLSSPTFGGSNGLTVKLTGSGALSLSAPGSIFFLRGSSPSARQTLIIDGDITLSGRAANDAPAVYLYANAGLEMRSGKITGNANSDSIYGGGGVFVNGYNSVFTLSGGEISGNTAASSDGGGVSVRQGGFTMTGGKINGNHAGDYGGGVYASGCSVAMSGGDICGNPVYASGSCGGGVYVQNGSLTLSGGGKISGNTASGYGGGVFADGGSVTMSGGEISGNTATYSGGGGVYLTNGGGFSLSGGVISGNTATHSGGGGVSATGSCTFTMSGGLISGNHASPGNTSGVNGGGGVRVSGSFNMSGGEISGNTAHASGSSVSGDITTNGGGGGVRVESGGSFTLSGSGKIINNNASGYGGGAYLGGGNSTLSGNGEIGGNSAYLGGGVYIQSADISLTLSGNGKISNNSASANGGGAYLYGGSLTLSDNGEIGGNSAGSAGGGVCINNTASFTMSGGVISGSTAGSGGGVAIWSGSFSKSGGIIYGDDGNDTDNTATAGDTYGHAVYSFASLGYYRDTTLGTAANISTSQVPASGTGYNWTKK
jgi:hypothetical protein